MHVYAILWWCVRRAWVRLVFLNAIRVHTPLGRLYLMDYVIIKIIHKWIKK